MVLPACSPDLAARGMHLTLSVPVLTWAGGQQWLLRARECEIQNAHEAGKLRKRWRQNPWGVGHGKRWEWVLAKPAYSLHIFHGFIGFQWLNNTMMFIKFKSIATECKFCWDSALVTWGGPECRSQVKGTVSWPPHLKSTSTRFWHL